MENAGRCKAKQLYLCLQRKVWLSWEINNSHLWMNHSAASDSSCAARHLCDSSLFAECPQRNGYSTHNDTFSPFFKKTKNSNEAASIYSNYLQWRPCSLVAAPSKEVVATFLKGASARRERDTREAILSRSSVICPWPSSTRLKTCRNLR